MSYITLGDAAVAQPIAQPLINMDAVCAQVDATWDPVANECKPIVPPPAASSASTMVWLGLGALALGFVWMMASKPKRRAMRNEARSEQWLTDFERLKACKSDNAMLLRSIKSLEQTSRI